MALSSCASPQTSPPPSPAQNQSQSQRSLQPPALATENQTVMLEQQDRIARFERLTKISGIEPPAIDTLYAPAGSAADISGPVPVTHVVFNERAFFDFDQDQPRSDSLPILDMIAENMRRDVPDVVLTIVGHTDAIGTDEYNDSLSERRALNVMKYLIARGVRAQQLSTVGMGKRQPAASNLTLEGRAKNRRVEFLISPSLNANLAVLQSRPIDPALLRTNVEGRPVISRRVEVLKPEVIQKPDQGEDVVLRQAGQIELAAPVAEPPVKQAQPEIPQPRSPEPAPVPVPAPIAPIVPAPLNQVPQSFN